MADEFDPEKFEDKYAHYFNELQRAYKNAFNQMNDRYDSELIHGIDQTVLNESEPFYEDGEFRVELPENPASASVGQFPSTMSCSRRRSTSTSTGSSRSCTGRWASIARSETTAFRPLHRLTRRFSRIAFRRTKGISRPDANSRA